MARERLQKLIAAAGVTSRRGAEQLIVDGRVAVNGIRAGLGDSADPDVDRIEVDGRPLAASATPVHLAVHKPRGYVSSAQDERGRRSVVSLVDAGGERLWPVGRLDVESEGLLLLSNDGPWANRVLHPRYGNEREYAALVIAAAVAGDAEPPCERRDAGGRPGPAPLGSHPAPPREVRRERTEEGIWVRVRLGEGRKREVRRLFTAIGCEVRTGWSGHVSGR